MCNTYLRCIKSSKHKSNAAMQPPEICLGRRFGRTGGTACFNATHALFGGLSGVMYLPTISAAKLDRHCNGNQMCAQVAGKVDSAALSYRKCVIRSLCFIGQSFACVRELVKGKGSIHWTHGIQNVAVIGNVHMSTRSRGSHQRV